MTFVVAVAFANVPLVQIDGFIPFIHAAVFITELVTAISLYANYANRRSPALAVLASGYLFTSLMVIAHTFTFPDAFLAGLSFGGPQTAAWLFVIWHFVFLVSAIGYVALKDRVTDAPGRSSATSQILVHVLVVFGAAVAIAAILITQDPYVLRLFLDRTTATPLANQTALFNLFVCAVAFGLLWGRQYSILDRWLMIAILATLLEMAMVTILTSRFTVGWYAMRIFSVTASAVVLIALLAETMALHGKLAIANVLLQRERNNRLMSLDAAISALAHENDNADQGSFCSGA